MTVHRQISCIIILNVIEIFQAPLYRSQKTGVVFNEHVTLHCVNKQTAWKSYLIAVKLVISSYG